MIKKFKSTIICVIMIMCIGLLSGCATYDNFVNEFFGDGSDLDTIKIALYEPITGEFSDEAAAEIRGLELANKLFPEVLGKQVELVYTDNGSDLNTAKTALEIFQRGGGIEPVQRGLGQEAEKLGAGFRGRSIDLICGRLLDQSPFQHRHPGVEPLNFLIVRRWLRHGNVLG